jgi:hypothetical protein
MAKRRRPEPCSPCPILDGLAALTEAHRNKINTEGLQIRGSVDLDGCFVQTEANANRWDYFIEVERKGELYLEVHEVSEEEVACLVSKANWLRAKIDQLAWPQTDGRPFFVAPTRGVSPYSLYGTLSLILASHRMMVVRKGDLIDKLLE